MFNPTVKKFLLSIFSFLFLLTAVVTFSNCTQNDLPVIKEFAEPKEFIQFEQFFVNVQKATLDDYSKIALTKVSSEKEFSKMRRHILSLYEGVVVNNSFVMNLVGHVDCIDINTQPGLKQNGQKLTIETPPPPMIVKDEDEEQQKAQFIEPMLNNEKKDRFGNLMYCEKGFIPMRRITLDELTRFKTLEDFLNKYGKAGETGAPIIK